MQVRTFRVAFTGDFLNESGNSAYGDVGLELLKSHDYVTHHFLMDQAPMPGDNSYWQRFYGMEVTPENILGLDGLIVLRPRVSHATFAKGGHDLVVIGRSGAGYDKIDLDACTENDVALFNAPLALNHSTASTALLFMLALAKQLPRQEMIVRQGRWELQGSVMGSEIQGRTLGIIGLGHSGRELARLVAPFDMRVLAYSPNADAVQAKALGVRLTTLAHLLVEADFVSLHCRLTEKTKQMIGSRELALMRPEAFFINIARGELVDQAALVDALRRGVIAGAGLDVFEVEPLPPNDPLTQLENVILTPHWSASTKDVWLATGKAMAEGILCAARGDVPENVVNTKVLDQPGFRAKLQRFEENKQLAAEEKGR